MCEPEKLLTLETRLITGATVTQVKTCDVSFLLMTSEGKAYVDGLSGELTLELNFE